MSRADRLILRVLLIVLPFRLHRHFPHFVKRLLNRWMRHVGDRPSDP